MTYLTYLKASRNLQQTGMQATHLETPLAHTAQKLAWPILGKRKRTPLNRPQNHVEPDHTNPAWQLMKQGLPELYRRSLARKLLLRPPQDLVRYLLADEIAQPNDSRVNWSERINQDGTQKKKSKPFDRTILSAWSSIPIDVRTNIRSRNQTLLEWVLNTSTEIKQRFPPMEAAATALYAPALQSQKTEWVNTRFRAFFDATGETSELLTGLKGHALNAAQTHLNAVHKVFLTLLASEIFSTIQVRMSAQTPTEELNSAWLAIKSHLNAQYAGWNDARAATRLYGTPNSVIVPRRVPQLNRFGLGNLTALLNREQVKITHTSTVKGGASLNNLEAIDLNARHIKDPKAARAMTQFFYSRFIKKTCEEIWHEKDRAAQLDFFKVYINKLKDSLSNTAEYPMTQALAVTHSAMAKVNLRANTSAQTPTVKHRIYDPSAGWGNRVYAYLALLNTNRIDKAYASDPNMEHNQIQSFLDGCVKLDTLSHFPKTAELKNLTLANKTIAENLAQALSEEPGQYSVYFSCPPYGDTLSVKHRRHDPKGDVMYEQYDRQINHSVDSFVDEFGIRLAILGGQVLCKNGQLLMQFNAQHALVLASILSESGLFNEIELARATNPPNRAVESKDPMLVSQLANSGQLYVMAARNEQTLRPNIRRNLLPATSADELIETLQSKAASLRSSDCIQTQLGTKVMYRSQQG
ncbi:hypothetical protein NQT62_02055 [Limnobacter humi]|uniref:DNA methylase adenine-specific domain-containing protein n=1 Tax=Limnobacter humi TaxID=1778671 RepID=A0ABT1WCJ4_9BURK|nr:hypothetical protein [Limnobacter humi]MCQ8895220.1 hypothetical protein [Limnobacter humi]